MEEKNLILKETDFNIYNENLKTTNNKIKTSANTRLSELCEKKGLKYIFKNMELDT